jgi:hypothetical protein
LDAWTDQFARFVEAKGKVEPGKYRAFGYEAPGHFLGDVRLAWRDIRMRFGSPRVGSSPAKQQRLGLNRDVTKEPKKSEGEKLRGVLLRVSNVANQKLVDDKSRAPDLLRR